eukprot:758616-Hanusia_phi.AAC.4
MSCGALPCQGASPAGSRRSQGTDTRRTPRSSSGARGELGPGWLYVALMWSRRHKIIESPKAGRYAQLWCRTCCNCESSNKPCGKLLGCACAMHWHTVTNRSYHEKTPFHQLATTLIMVGRMEGQVPWRDGFARQTAYNDAMGGECKFDEVIGVIGMVRCRGEQLGLSLTRTQSYYKPSSESKAVETAVGRSL